MSHHVSPGPVDDPQYATLDTLTRCLHFDDFELCHSGKKMCGRRIRMGWSNWLSGVGSVLWFGPSLPSTNTHNWYGNVSFIMDMDDVISRFGDTFYYIDKQEFSTHTASRVLLTKKTSSALTPVNVNSSMLGSPIRKKYGWKSDWESVSACKSGRFDTIVPHHLEIAIEVEDSDCEWLYSNCSIEANDHSLANTKLGFDSNTCHRYNTFGNTCPHELSRDAAETKLNELRATD